VSFPHYLLFKESHGVADGKAQGRNWYAT